MLAESLSIGSISEGWLVGGANEEEKIIHYNHSMQLIMLDMTRCDQVIDYHLTKNYCQ